MKFYEKYLLNYLLKIITKFLEFSFKFIRVWRQATLISYHIKLLEKTHQFIFHTKDGVNKYKINPTKYFDDIIQTYRRTVLVETWWIQISIHIKCLKSRKSLVTPSVCSTINSSCDALNFYLRSDIHNFFCNFIIVWWTLTHLISFQWIFFQRRNKNITK